MPVSKERSNILITLIYYLLWMQCNATHWRGSLCMFRFLHTHTLILHIIPILLSVPTFSHTHTHTYSLWSTLICMLLHKQRMNIIRLLFFPLNNSLMVKRNVCRIKSMQRPTDLPNEQTNERMTVMVWLEICIWAKQKRWHLSLSLSLCVCEWALILLSLLRHIIPCPLVHPYENTLKETFRKFCLINIYARHLYTMHAYTSAHSAFHFFFGGWRRVRKALRRLKCKISICKSVSVLIDWK